VDEKTRTMLDQLKAPKRIDSQISAQSESNLGSAWNKAGTWEEKDMTTWAQENLKIKLGKLAAKAPMDMDAVLQSTATCDDMNSGASSSLLNDAHLALPLVARVKEVKSVEGSASVASSRGSLKHMFDFGFEVEWEVKAEASAGDTEAPELPKGKTYKGTLVYCDVTSQSNYDVKLTLKKKLSEVAEKRIRAAVDALKQEIEVGLQTFICDFKEQRL